MNKKIAILSLAIALIFSYSAACGEENDFVEGMGKKFFRGAVNILTGWVELPMQTVKGFRRGCPLTEGEDNKVVGTLCGLFRGIGHTIGRTAWGVVELAGFWAANPETNAGFGTRLDAEYAWEEGEPYNYLDPDFGEATLAPMGRKFMRGLGGALFGFAELPGQIGKGIQDKAPDAGILRGLWFWYSRELYGIGDVLTSIFPTPEDNPGYIFDQEYAWDAIVDVIEE